MSLEQLSQSFLAVALTEKTMAWEKVRLKEQNQEGGKTARRPSSWSKKVVKGGTDVEELVNGGNGHPSSHHLTLR